MEMSDKIRKRRKELNLTLEEIAEAVGVSASSIQRYENGIIKNMRRDKIKKLADVLKCTPAYLMGWSNEITNSITNSNVLQGNNSEMYIVNDKKDKTNLTSQEEEILRIFRSLSIRDQTDLLSYAYKLEALNKSTQKGVN